MSKWRAGVIRGTQITPGGNQSSDAASGVWRASDAAYWVSQNQWPTLPGDPLFPYVSLLLQDNGVSGSQNNIAADSSPNNFSFTRVGNVTQGSFSPYGSNWSNYFDGNSYFSTPDSTSYDLAANNWTFETWVNFSSLPTSGDAASFAGQWYDGTLGWWFYLYNNAGTYQLYFSYSTSGSNQINLSANWTPDVSTWYHIAYVRTGTSLLIFVNGVQVGSTQTLNATIFNASSSMWVGSRIGVAGAGYYLNGYLSNMRLVNGTAVYTSTFTPPTSPLTAISGTSLLTCRHNRFQDGSTNNFTITVTGNSKVTSFSPFSASTGYSAATNGGSLFFDGSGDATYVDSSNAALTLGTGDFTIELWVYQLALGGTQSWVSTYGGPSAGYRFSPTNVLQFSWGDTGILDTGTVGADINQWSHVAVTRSGTTIRIFKNGKVVATGTDSTNLTGGSTQTTLGRIPTYNSWYYNGFMSDVRIVKGTAVYTADYTPPTSPLTAISGTALLARGTNAGIYDASKQAVIETLGDTQVNTTIKKYGTGSIAFDGTNDWLEHGIKTDWTWLHNGLQDWTIEWWMYAASTSAQGIICTNTNSISGGVGMVMGIAQIGAAGCIGGHFTRGVDGNRMDWYTAGDVFSTNTWTHVACMFNKTTKNMSVYINGTAVSVTNQNVVSNSPTGADGSAFAYVNTAPSFNLNIGRVVGGVTVGSYYNGYIDDLRITRGIRRYTSNFTPPTQALPPR